MCAAAAMLSGEIDTVEEITRLRLPRTRRGCFRLQFEDGRTVKARRFQSVERRETFTALSRLLEGLPFSRVLCAHGAATIEEWIDGSPPADADWDAERIHPLATILGTLHTRSAPPELVPVDVPDVAWYVERLREQLSALCDGGQLDSAAANRVFDRAVERTPRDLENGIIHTDFHPRNMVMKANGEVWTVDNEDLRIGARDYDIARTWRQWRMTRGQRKEFAKAYAELRSLDAFLAHEEFWAVCTLVSTALYHLRYGESIELFLTQLEQLGERVEQELWLA